MNENDRHAIAAMVAEMVAANKTPHHCMFDDETIAAIKDWAMTYGKLRKAAWWAGGVIGVTLLGSMATGFAYVVWVGFKRAAQTGE